MTILGINRISLSELIDNVHNSDNATERFCFILGAGASVSSGIPTGADLAREWLKDIKNSGKYATKQWLKNIGISEEDINKNPGEYYSLLYEKRFSHLLDGYLELQKKMESITPSIGYYYLSHILADTINNLVITTNFDSLTEDAVYTYMGKKALVITHEALAKYIFYQSEEDSDVELYERPIVAKIHRDLFLQPNSRLQDVKDLSPEWKDVLKKIMEIYTPIVIGYGGNDGSFMGFLESVADSNKKIYWCYRDNPNERINILLEKYNGYLIHIEDFDETMYLFGSKFKYVFSEQKIYDHLHIQKCINKLHEIETKINTKIEEQNTGTFEYNYNEGIKYYNLREYTKAVEYFSEAIKFDIKTDYCYYMRGKSYYNYYEYRKAVEDFDEAIKHNSKNIYYYYIRGKSYYKAYKYIEAANDFSIAIELFDKEDIKVNKAIKFNIAKYCYLCGISYEKSHKYNESIYYLKKAHELFPVNDQYRIAYIKSSKRLQKYDE